MGPFSRGLLLVTFPGFSETSLSLGTLWRCLHVRVSGSEIFLALTPMLWSSCSLWWYGGSSPMWPTRWALPRTKAKLAGPSPPFWACFSLLQSPSTSIPSSFLIFLIFFLLFWMSLIRLGVLWLYWSISYSDFSYAFYCCWALFLQFSVQEYGSLPSLLYRWLAPTVFLISWNSCWHFCARRIFPSLLFWPFSDSIFLIACQNGVGFCPFLTTSIVQ